MTVLKSKTALEFQNKVVKKQHMGNVTAAFGADLLMLGAVSIPNLLLKYYPKMNISDSEMMLLIQLIKLRAENNIFPTIEVLGQDINGGTEQAQYLLQQLIDKELLAISAYYDFRADLVLDGLDFNPLYEKLSELWACAKVKEIEETKQALNQKNTPLTSPPVDNILVLFEQEFARPLSPIEVERIRYWSAEYDPLLITEALQRAVLMGKSNFRYIDAILLEWSKNNLRTLPEITKYDQAFQQRRGHLKPAYTRERDQNKVVKPDQPDQQDKHKKIFNALLMS
ncbi:MAG: DnaD domain protein [Desulfotomaculum sp.]|nr:DnaD domain protein [Desulfotomaculum sp.]